VFDGSWPRRLGANYLLRLRSHGLPPATVQALERITKRSGPLLRLPADVEDAYRREWRITANHVRVLLSVVPALVYSIFPLWADRLLGVPEDLAALIRLVAFGLIIPVSLLAALIAWSLPARPVAGASIALAGLAIVLSVEAVRAQAAAAGYRIDHSLAVCVPVGLSILGGFRFDRVLGLVGAYVLVIFATVPLFDAPARTPTMWLGEGVLLCLSTLAALWMETSQRRSWAARRLLQLQAHQDPLTGLRNRRSFELHFDIVAAEARREKRPLFFALADLDHFKRVNDRYGHEYGDGALSEVAVVLSQFARRPLDAVARLGGEEFAILLYDCDRSGALTRLQALVDQVRLLGIDNEDAPLGVLTISAGGVVSDGTLPMSELYHSADNHLYAVKHRGRNGARVGPIVSS
jgi:diguanylate cyclase (GGDEF)-like protein